MKEEQNEVIGERIRRMREQVGWTQETLAELINISPVHLSRIENGKVTPRIDILIRLSEVLQVSIDELLFGRYNLNREFEMIEREMQRLNDADKRFIFRVFWLFYQFVSSGK